MTAGAVMSVARISVAFTPQAAEPAIPRPATTAAADPAAGDPYVAGPQGVVPPAAPGAGTGGPSRAVRARSAGRRRPTDPVGPTGPASPGAVPPTEPTRRLYPAGPGGAAAGAPAAVTPLVTIGVYEFDVERFLAALRGGRRTCRRRAPAPRRARRALRGANARRLQAALADARIAYSHHRELAPTTELRHLQYAADDRAGVGRRSRELLDPEYVRRYTREVLDHADLDALVATLPAGAATALLCVEADRRPATARCRRAPAERYGLEVAHIRPWSPINRRRLDERSTPGAPQMRRTV